MTETPTHTPLRLNAGDETRVMEDRPDGVCLPVCDVKCGGMSGRTVKEGEALAALIVQAVNSHHRLVEALEGARKIIADIDDYMKRPSRGDWGEECACCMGELLDDDRNAITKIDAALKEAGHG